MPLRKIIQRDIAVSLSLIDAQICQSELNVTRQRSRIENLERGGNDSKLSKAVLGNFKTALELQYAHRGRVRRDLSILIDKSLTAVDALFYIRS